MNTDKTVEQLQALVSKLDNKLKTMNDEYDNGNEEPIDNIFETMTITVNDITVSLGSMDTYGAFCKFVEAVQNEI
jgi:hypothetical protein